MSIYQLALISFKFLLVFCLATTHSTFASSIHPSHQRFFKRLQKTSIFMSQNRRLPPAAMVFMSEIDYEFYRKNLLTIPAGQIPVMSKTKKGLIVSDGKNQLKVQVVNLDELRFLLNGHPWTFQGKLSAQENLQSVLRILRKGKKHSWLNRFQFFPEANAAIPVLVYIAIMWLASAAVAVPYNCFDTFVKHDKKPYNKNLCIGMHTAGGPITLGIIGGGSILTRLYYKNRSGITCPSYGRSIKIQLKNEKANHIILEVPVQVTSSENFGVKLYSMTSPLVGVYQDNKRHVGTFNIGWSDDEIPKWKIESMSNKEGQQIALPSASDSASDKSLPISRREKSPFDSNFDLLKFSQKYCGSDKYKDIRTDGEFVNFVELEKLAWKDKGVDWQVVRGRPLGGFDFKPNLKRPRKPGEFGWTKSKTSE